MKKAMLFIIISIIVSIRLNSQNNMNIIAQFQGEHHTSKFGMSMASLDFNHDGYIDLVVGSPSYGYAYNTSPSRGKAYIYYGGPTFNSSTPASVTLEGTYNGTTGWQILGVYSVGDINGDGFADLCIMDYAPWSTWEQRLMFFYGGTANLDNPDYIMNISSNTNIAFVNKLGDVNGDGLDDVGFAYRISGQDLTFSILMGGSMTENVIMTYPYYLATGAGLYTLSGIGDINNDGYADFTIAYSNNNLDTGYHLITIYYGNSAGVYANPQTLIQTQQPITKISKPLGDMNNDGFDDFMGYTSNAGTHVWLGSNNINMSTPSFNLTPGWTGGEASQSLEHGDFNQDGFEDAVGASFNRREADVYLGGTIPNGTSDLMLHQYLHDNFGFSLATGDYNADGYCDLAIAASHEYAPWPTGTFYGFVFVYGGNAQLADTTVSNEDVNHVPDIAQINFSLYPNPTQKKNTSLYYAIQGELPKNIETADIILYNIKGQVTGRYAVNPKHLNEGKGTLTINSLISGTYISVLIINNSRIASAKITIQ